jgi:hypothetical protein
MLMGEIGKKLERTSIDGSLSYSTSNRLHMVNTDVSQNALQQYPSRFK